MGKKITSIQLVWDKKNIETPILHKKNTKKINQSQKKYKWNLFLSIRHIKTTRFGKL